MHWQYFPCCWNHTYKLCFTVQQITTALVEYRGRHFVSPGASSTAKIEASFQQGCSRLQSCRVVCLLLCSWAEAEGVAQSSPVCQESLLCLCSCRTIPWSLSAPAESQIPFPPSGGVWAALLPHSLLGVLHAPSDLRISHERLMNSQN